MKATDFFALPEGTVVLLRPSGPGSRDHDARHELILARLDGMDRYQPVSQWARHDPLGQLPGFRASPSGHYRAITFLKRLYRHSPNDTDEHWVPFAASGASEAANARNVVGVWDDVKEAVLSERREHFAKVTRAKEDQRAKETADREAREAALAVIRPAMRAAGIPEEGHAATRSWARLRDRTFTTEEVALIIHSIKEVRPDAR